MASKIKDLTNLMPKCKGIDSRGDARERVQAAAKVLANAEARTLAAAVRLLTVISKNKKIRDTQGQSECVNASVFAYSIISSS